MQTKNDNERRLWVLNDESLYRWWQSTKMAMRRFLKENREKIDDVISRRLNGDHWGPV